MSFIGESTKGTTYNPGYFLAYGDENVTRETREFARDSAMAVTGKNGTAHIPMGTAYPTNDGNAIGIAYEDVDVTTGNMPGSVVTGGAVVYEDRLAITSVDYDAVTPAGTENPSNEGWYERSGSAGSYVYTLSTDTTVGSGKTYYAQTVTRIVAAAKAALEALGFKFIASGATVVRPDWEV